MLVPQKRGPLQEQAQEIFLLQRDILHRHGRPMTVTAQTVFLRDPGQLEECRRIFAGHFGSEAPATNFVFQAPCGGADLAVEGWAIGGEGVKVEHPGAHTLAVSYEGMRWVHCAGIGSEPAPEGVYRQTSQVLHALRDALEAAGSGFEHVLRTWFYLGDITEAEAGTQRYKELNRARTDFYHKIKFQSAMLQPSIPQGIYPASTAIGMRGRGLVAGCLALQTSSSPAMLLALETPQQPPAFAYPPRHSPHSPKFSRAVALLLDKYVTTWVSGTASVVHSVSRHPGDIVRQTEQTIENIERLISAENFGFHGVKHRGACLDDLAKVRVYLKRAEDFPACRAVCEERFGSVPAVYVVADVCRPELLVEIEGVAFAER
jgi:enamine deaminase RidA (YjgF/YER057c/UK114 family)